MATKLIRGVRHVELTSIGGHHVGWIEEWKLAPWPGMITKFEIVGETVNGELVFRHDREPTEADIDDAHRANRYFDLHGALPPGWNR